LIESSGNLNGHPHLQTCELCRALLVDLQTIAEAARQLFPVVEPRDDLWKKIETALERESSGAKESREMK
jgi:predicted anti-sigma-YlaC factor YlaD